VKLKSLIELSVPKIAVFDDGHGTVNHNKLQFAGITLDGEPVLLMLDIDGNFIDPRTLKGFSAIVSLETVEGQRKPGRVSASTEAFVAGVKDSR
jgi:hypothetical protein